MTMSETNKTIYFEKFGLQHLKQQGTSLLPLGPREVRVRFHAASLNFRDLLVIKGLYDPKVLSRGQLIPLSDAAGEIVEVGNEVVRFRVGDRVAALFFQNWWSGECTYEMIASALGGSIDGVLTKYKTLSESGLIHLPENLSYEEGATLPCAALTAWHALINANPIKAGDTVLIQGTGGVSLFSLQFAKLSGAQVIITSSDNKKLAKAQKLGADHTINYCAQPNWEIEVRQFTKDRGVDHVIDVGGANTLSKSLKAAKIGGTISTIGILSGTACDVTLLPILMKALRIQGIYVGSGSMFADMNKAIQSNDLHPVIDKTFSFDQTKEALQYLESGQHFGKVVIKID